MEVCAIASVIALPREGYLESMFQMFSFLNSNHHGLTVVDTTEPDIDKTQFPTKDLQNLMVP